MGMQAVNPFLPGFEYIPDGEPHVFGDRLYLFGSHDRFGGKKFCLNDYVVWSAPIDDLGNWRFDGTIYHKTQDPDNKDGKLEMWAPDVALGPDGRYYLYYCLANHPKIGVAVCDTPAGKYEFAGYVHDSSGVPYGLRSSDSLPFDPAVLVDDDGRIHLYAGQAPMSVSMAKWQEKTSKFSYHMELASNMLTLQSEPKPICPNVCNSTGTGFEGHEFFEANSIRKFNAKYYFIYASVLVHELCWSVSDNPDGGFQYGGTLISNGDIGLNGPVPKSFSVKNNLEFMNYIGNNHGSVEKIGDAYYVFYHRHTNRHMYSRQACADRIELRKEGGFSQTEMTSCGLNGAPLSGIGPAFSSTPRCNAALLIVCVLLQKCAEAARCR